MQQRRRYKVSSPFDPNPFRRVARWALLIPLFVGGVTACLEDRPIEGITGPILAPAGEASFSVAATNYTYTTDADFDEGTLVNVNHDSPNNNQLQLNTTSGTFPFIWVALSQRCTIAKINTQTGAILGEYRTVSDATSCVESSRTTVGLDGSVWVGHRGGPGSIARVGLVELNQCVDRNGDNVITTSTGYGDVKAWPGNLAPVSAALDECILAAVNTGGQDSRHMSVDANGDLWVGDRVGGSIFRKYSSAGVLLAGPHDFNCGGYGGLIDGNGVIWSATSGGSVLRWDPATAPSTATCIPINNYGMAVDGNGNIWVSTLGEGIVRKLDPAGNVIGTFSQGQSFAQGLAVDADGDVWISSSLFGGTVVSHLLNNGTFVGHVTGTGVGSTGIAVDADGKIWSVNRESHNATRIDPNAGPVGGGGANVGAVDLTVSFPATPGRPVPYPYNYSDMTGAQLFNNTAPQGSWTVIQDGGAAGSEWRTVTWNTEAQGSVPPGASITVEARAAESEAALGAQSYMTVANGTDFSLTGRYIQVRVTLAAGDGDASPVLSDLTIEGGDEVPPELSVTVSQGTLWPPNHKYHTIAVNVVASDDQGDVTIAAYVVSSEPDDVAGNGDGNTTGDVKVTHNHPTPGASVSMSSNASPQVVYHPGDTLELRAERQGAGSGRGRGP